MKKMLLAWSAALVTAQLVGCASGVSLDESVPVETVTPAQVSAPAPKVVDTRPRPKPAPPSQAKQSTINAADLARVIYFDFDSYVIKEEFRGLVDSYAKLLTNDRKRSLTIEGHADERGGREYNLALGQKRAVAVLQSLELLGAVDLQLEAVSFGKERPAVQGNDEAAYEQNRRAELKLR